MIDVMTSVRIRADAKAEWQKAQAKLEIVYDRGGVSPEFIREMQIKVAERERFYRRVESICRQNGIPDEKQMTIIKEDPHGFGCADQEHKREDI